MSLLRGLRLVLCGLALACAQATFAAPADDIKALIEKGDSKAAYELGRKYPDQLGEPAFDFYFGVAAIDSGHAGEGVLALERYVVNFPDNHNARLELARGYFVMGDDQRAREEFNNVLKLNPPINHKLRARAARCWHLTTRCRASARLANRGALGHPLRSK